MPDGLCDDSDVCTDDGWNPLDESCEGTSIGACCTDDTECDDGDVSTLDICNTDISRCAPANIDVDIHPVQVVQHPPLDEPEETTTLVADKATMVRVFVDLDDSYPNEIDGVTGRCSLVGGSASHTIEATLLRESGKTYVIPTGKHHGGLGAGHEDYIFNAFNCFTGARAIHPAEGSQTLAFT